MEIEFTAWTDPCSVSSSMKVPLLTSVVWTSGELIPLQDTMMISKINTTLFVI